MAVYLPIVSEFRDGGIKAAVKEFRTLETAGQKAQFALRKAALPAAAALGGLAVAAVDAAKAAAEDQAAAEKLATTLRNTTGATDSQIASVEKFISATSVAAAVADDELRPALDTLLVGTKDAAASQDLLNLALDISAGTGKDLQTVSAALAKAYNGQTGALKKLDPSLAKVLKDGASTDEVFQQLSTTFGGQAAAAAGTAQGKMASLSIALGEAKESIGAAVLPLAQQLLPKLTELAQWISDNSGLVTTLAVGIGAIAAAILVANGALAAWNAVTAITAAVNAVLGTSFSALWVATGVGVILAVIAALAILQAKFDIFGKLIRGLRTVFAGLWDGIKAGFRFVVDAVKGYANLWLQIFGKVYNAIADGWNSTIGKLEVPGWVPVFGGRGVPDLPKWSVPQLADGGVVSSATLALIGEAGPEAVVPLDRLNTGGSTVINVNGALDPVSVARQIRDLLNADARRNGRVVIL
jgi:hypothetical protein